MDQQMFHQKLAELKEIFMDKYEWIFEEDDLNDSDGYSSKRKLQIVCDMINCDLPEYAVFFLEYFTDISAEDVRQNHYNIVECAFMHDRLDVIKVICRRFPEVAEEILREQE